MPIIENYSNKKLKQIEVYLLELGLLRLNRVKKNQFVGVSLEDGISFLINLMNRDPHYTISIKTRKKQCNPMRRRSQGDLFRIIKYYYPNVTFKEVRSCLFKMVNTKTLRTNYCRDIEKRVFFRFAYWNNPDEGPYTYLSIGYPYLEDEFGLKLKISRI